MIEALESAKDDRAALYAALDAWRGTRDPLLAAIVEHLGARVRGAPIAKESFHQSWLERAASAQPEDVEPLLESLAKQVDDGQGWWPIRPTQQRFAPLLERVRALALLRDDPRVARALTELVRRGPWIAGWAGVMEVLYGPILALIARIDDPRCAEALTALHARPVHRSTSLRDYLEGALPATVAEMTKWEPVDEALRARIEAVAHRLGVVSREDQRVEASSASGEELLAAIYADPDDDGAREVYADFLLEQKDPRGELIALQFAEHRGAATAKDKKRIASLIRAHQDEWLGELAIVTKKRVFRRGFLEEAELHSAGSATPDLWDRVLADERLSTVRVLEKGKANEGLYSQFLASPTCRSFRRVTAITSNTVGALAAATAPLRIEIVRLDRPSRDSLEVLAEATTLPSLHTLEVLIEEGRTDAVLRSIEKSGVGARLQCVAVVCGWSTDASDVGLTITKLESLGLPEVRVSRRGVDITARRDGDERTMSLRIRHGYELLEVVRSLPTCDRLALSCEKELPGGAGVLEHVFELRQALTSRARSIEVDNIIGPMLGFPGGTS